MFKKRNSSFDLFVTIKIIEIMKRIIQSLSVFSVFFFVSTNAQTITSCAGDGTYIADPGAPCPADGGQATSTTLNMPTNVKVDGAGNQYIFTTGAGWSCFRIKKIDVSGSVSNAAGDGNYGAHYGDGGPASLAGIATYNSFCVDNSGNIYISESWSKPSGYQVTSIRKVNSAGIITTLAQSDTTGLLGDGGPASAATFSANDIDIDASGNIYIVDGNRIRKIAPSGVISTVAGIGTQGYSGDGGPATNAQLALPGQLVLDAEGNIYFTDATDISSPLTTTVLRKINSSGTISTLADTSIMRSYAFSGLAYDNSEKCIYFSDLQNVVKKISSSGLVSTVAGVAGVAGYNGDSRSAISATLNGPAGVFVDASGNLFIADRNNYRIRKVTPHTTGIDQEITATNHVEISPNPSNGRFSLEVSSLSTEPMKIEIFNALGQLEKEIQSFTNSKTEISIDCSPGIYILCVTFSDRHLTKKVLID